MPIGFLTDAERDRLNRFPIDIAPTDLLAYFTLSETDLEFIQTHRGDHNRLGYALQLVALRLLGFAPDDGSTAPRRAVAYVALQLGVSISALAQYGDRIHTRTDHLREIQAYVGFRDPRPLDFARYVRLSLGGVPFQIIGTDGGFIEAPVTAEEVLLPPGDRVELAVGPFEKEGEVYAIDDLPFYRGTGKKRVERFGTIRIAPPKASTARIPPRLREIAPLVTGTASVTRTVELGFKVSLRRGFDFVIDGERHHHAEPVNVGEMQVWDVVNTTQIDHPFHLHGFFFQILEIDGKKPAWRSLEDVVNERQAVHLVTAFVVAPSLGWSGVAPRVKALRISS